jgi:hypothetical protein
MSKSDAPPLLVLLFLLACFPAVTAKAAPVPFGWQLGLRVNVGAGSTSGVQLPALSGSGVAQVSAGSVSIGAGSIAGAVPTTAGFGGTLSNGAGVFSFGAVTPGFACPSNPNQLVGDLACVSTGGFGGSLGLSGILHLGQGLSPWGAGGASLGQTASGQGRVVQAAPWTTGFATAWYFLTIDPTPFALADHGTFRGLPSTFTGTGLPGFSLVTPMVITTTLGPILPVNARGIATLSIAFVPEPHSLLLVATGILALALHGRVRVSR